VDNVIKAETIAVVTEASLVGCMAAPLFRSVDCVKEIPVSRSYLHTEDRSVAGAGI
jgi:hypothetical protein